MATGPEHYREAERLLEPGEHDMVERDLLALDIALAQVHATLALSAATALRPADQGVTADWTAWYHLASDGPADAKRRREEEKASQAEWDAYQNRIDEALASHAEDGVS